MLMSSSEQNAHEHAAHALDARLRALARLLTDEGHMTPYALLKITQTLDADEHRPHATR